MLAMEITLSHEMLNVEQGGISITEALLFSASDIIL